MQRCICIHHPVGRAPRHQLEPLQRSYKTLERRGWRMEVVPATSLAAKVDAVRTRVADAVVVQFSWASAPHEVIDCVRRIRDVLPAETRLVFDDTYDGATSPHFGVLPHVDAYLKKQLPTDLSDAAIAPAEGGKIARFFEGDTAPQRDPATTALLEAHGDRLHLSWNVGAADFVLQQLQFRRGYLRASPCPLKARPINVHLRANIGAKETDHRYGKHRLAALRCIEALPVEMDRIAVGTRPHEGNSVSFRKYSRELNQSRIVVSPFGFGEICYRDFEAVAAGCLLIKPDMAHVRSEPNIFTDGVSFRAYRWDSSDLREVLFDALDHLDRSQEIASHARAELLRYFEQEPWVDAFLKAIAPAA